MEGSFYKILNIKERILPYFFNMEFSEEISQKRNEIIKEAYEREIKKLEQEYQSKLKALEEDKDLKVGAKKIYIRRKYTPERVKQKNIRGIDEDLEEYKIKCEQLKKEYKIKFRELEIAFENLKTEESRQNYNANMDYVEQVSAEHMAKITEEIDEKVRRKRIEDTYSKVSQYNPNLIKQKTEGKAKGQRLVVLKPSKDTTEIPLRDERNKRNITIKQTGVVLFANSADAESFVNEYQITRRINGEFKVDTVYTTLNLPELGFNRKKGQPFNKEYYECVVNELLSEEVIEGSKYNGGYVGLIEREGDGYTTTLKRSKLNDEEKENLAAVMILRESKARQTAKNLYEGDGR